MKYLLIFAGLLGLQTVFGETLRTESTESTAPPAADSRAQNRYNYEDLLNAARILLEDEEYGRAQELLEMALFLRPRELTIFKMLARIYKETRQPDRLAGLAESVSGYLLPEGEEDLFWEEMMTQAIILNSRQKPDKAWEFFQRLYTALQRREGRRYELIRELEGKVHAPFLARIYLWLEKRGEEQSFQWGQLGDYFLYIEKYEEAAAFFEREFAKSDFDPIYLFSYARVLYERKQFALSQVYLNVSRRLNPNQEKLQDEADQLQNILGSYPYDYGYPQIRMEADLMLRYGAIEEGVARLKDLLLVSDDVPNTVFELGKTVLGYKDQPKAQRKGREILLHLASLEDASFEDLGQSLKLLIRSEFLDAATVVLNALRQKNPARFRKEPSIQQELQRLLNHLLANAGLLRRNRAPIHEQLNYLRLCQRLAPENLEVFLRMIQVWKEKVQIEKKNRLELARETVSELDDFLVLLASNGIRKHPGEPDLMEGYVELMRYLPPELHERVQMIRFLKQGMQAHPEEESLSVWLAQVYMDQDYALQALDVLEPLLGTDNPRVSKIGAQAARRAAESAWARGHLPEVIQFMEMAHRFHDQGLLDSTSALWLGRSYQGMEQNQELLQLMQDFEKQFGPSAESWYLQALAHQSLFEYQKAIDAYDKVLQLKDGSASPFEESCRANRASLIRILQYQSEDEGG